MSLDLAQALAFRIIAAAQQTRFRGAGGYSSQSFAAKGDPRPFPQADFEREHVDDFFRHFPAFSLPDEIRGRAVLDLGSGYGGKTVQYLTQYGAARVCGVEPHPNMIEQSRRYAQARGAPEIEFQVCGPREIPYPSSTFDVVLTHDVLEHVEDPRATMEEIRRVLRPGGLSFNVFPVYLGALSHHLDYVVTMPGLHWFFSPHTLVTAVNRVLASHPGFGTAPQSAPARSFDGAREVLPNLNGLSGEHLDELFRRFEIVNLRRIGLGLRGLGVLANSRLPVRFRDMVTGTVVCVLRKRG